jgi:hypothetical protein
MAVHILSGHCTVSQAKTIVDFAQLLVETDVSLIPPKMPYIEPSEAFSVNTSNLSLLSTVT